MYVLDLASIEQDAFSCSRLARVNVRTNSNVPDLAERRLLLLSYWLDLRSVRLPHYAADAWQKHALAAVAVLLLSQQEGFGYCPTQGAHGAEGAQHGYS
jgi:hypothetical protein